MIHHVTYASHRMTISEKLCRESAARHGCVSHTNIGLRPWFESRYRESMLKDRGAGYWIWKPHVIAQAMVMATVGDVVVYTDAGVEFIDGVHHLVDAMDDDIMLFGNHYQHRDWCKREVFDGYGCRDGFQVQASAMLFGVGTRSREFVEKWNLWCGVPDMINDKLWLEQYPGFQEHRHDQAILTAVAQKYNLPLHWWPAVYNDGAFTYDKGTYTDTYPVIFHHHRKRNDEW